MELQGDELSIGCFLSQLRRQRYIEIDGIEINAIPILDEDRFSKRVGEKSDDFIDKIGRFIYNKRI